MHLVKGPDGIWRDMTPTRPDATTPRSPSFIRESTQEQRDLLAFGALFQMTKVQWARDYTNQRRRELRRAAAGRLPCAA